MRSEDHIPWAVARLTQRLLWRSIYVREEHGANQCAMFYFAPVIARGELLSSTLVITLDRFINWWLAEPS